MGLYRYRSSNYTTAEKILLIEVVKEYADIIDSRRNEVNTETGKKGVWDLIAETFNLRKGLGPRPAMSLRKCYSNMKTIVKNVIRTHNLESLTGSIQEDWEMNIQAVASKLGLSYEVTYDFMYNVLKYRVQGDTLSLERVRKGSTQEPSAPQHVLLPVQKAPPAEEETMMMPVIESVRSEVEKDEVIPEPAVVWVTSETAGYDFLPEEDALDTEPQSKATSSCATLGDQPQSNATSSCTTLGDQPQSNATSSSATPGDQPQNNDSSCATLGDQPQNKDSSCATQSKGTTQDKEEDNDDEDSNSSHVRKKMKV